MIKRKEKKRHDDIIFITYRFADLTYNNGYNNSQQLRTGGRRTMTEMVVTILMCVLVVISSMIGTILFHLSNEYRRRTEEIKKEMKDRQEGKI